MENVPFYPADILLPKKDFEKWAVVACDQYTGESEYWEDVENIVGDTPSALRLTLPEIYLSGDVDSRIEKINKSMTEYIENGIFNEYKNAFIYLERTLYDGKVRHGIIGKVDLTAYDYNKGAKSLIRATEGTIMERIPPRVKIRENAPLELPHIMILIDDPEKTVIEPIAEKKHKLEKLYDFELMKQGGHAEGYLADDNNAITEALGALMQEGHMLFAMGDGNHSLATAKACYEKNPTEKNRYALVEIVNIHDEALTFEPIYRVIYRAKAEDILAAAKDYFTEEENGQKITVVTEDGDFTLSVKAENSLTVGTLQIFLDKYLSENKSARIDYIHGEEAVRSIVKKQNAVGFIFDGMTKSELFPAVEADGALPRKTFSMGHARDKRYYLEARRIK